MNRIEFQKNRTLIIILAVLLVLFLLAIQGMETVPVGDWAVVCRQDCSSLRRET